MAMSVEARPELVGKRFLCVSGEDPLKLGDIGRWGWRAGVVRAVTHRDNDNPELTVKLQRFVFTHFVDTDMLRIQKYG